MVASGYDYYDDSSSYYDEPETRPHRPPVEFAPRDYNYGADYEVSFLMWVFKNHVI